ncbi:hypothetical protein [Amycolatopsis sp. cmx-4-54]|uniref:hypothetical protein n=1 Tax=Amycolatopsis sp. cmx-4-54 TaxID=2790936 RepID=UPI00397DAEFA
MQRGPRDHRHDGGDRGEQRLLYDNLFTLDPNETVADEPTGGELLVKLMHVAHAGGWPNLPAQIDATDSRLTTTMGWLDALSCDEELTPQAAALLSMSSQG